jgi:tetratricopeptide (TPR) repeat protein
MLISQDSTNSYFYKQRGICSTKLDKIDDAIDYFQKSLSLNHRDVSVMLPLSQLLFQVEELDSALFIVDQGLQIYPENLQLIKRKAEIDFKRKDYKDAITNFEIVVERENASALTYKKLGMSYFFEEDFTFALLNLLDSYEKDSSDAMTCFYIGLSYKDHNLYEKSILFLNKAIELTIPNYLSEIYTHLASSQEHEKYFVEAIQSYREALDYQPSKKILSFYLASVYDQYYADREVPLLYYQKFLRDNKAADAKLIEYAESRVKALKQEMHFRAQKADNR